MSKRKTVVFLSGMALLVLWFCLPAVMDVARGGIMDPCASESYSASGGLLACPRGDGDRLDSRGLTITVVVKRASGEPIPGIPVFDFWLIGCTNAVFPVGGAVAIDADAASNSEGMTTISGAWAAGGCDASGVRAVVWGVAIENANEVCDTGCLPVVVVSPDINVDLAVDVIDLGLFSQSYTSPPQVYQPCLDYNFDGAIDLVDFSLFSQHYLHS